MNIKVTLSLMTFTLTSDHINNARNEFLRSQLYEKMLLSLLGLLAKIKGSISLISDTFPTLLHM